MPSKHQGLALAQANARPAVANGALVLPPAEKLADRSRHEPVLQILAQHARAHRSAVVAACGHGKAGRLR